MTSSSAASASRISRVARFAWATLCVNVGVVLWGAYVRASGSGAGCGNKWPLCGGDPLSASAKIQTIIEFTHRMTSGVALFMVAGLAVWAWRRTSRGDWARYAAVIAAILLANEALLGAGLVLLDYVAQNRSTGRVFFLCLHFGNTLLLLGTLALTAAWLAKGNSRFRLIENRRERAAIFVGLAATLCIGITGTIAALGDTLFPSTSLRSSLAQDITSGAPTLLHWRLLHPAVAIIAACYVLWVITRTSALRGRISRAAIALVSLFMFQVGLGVMNVLLLAPVWLQILHLLVADVIWIVLVLASADLVLEPVKAKVDEPAPVPSATSYA